jgi:ABC-type transport system involved in cytochrome bd biosynthesis fused ATPase/permease subunit
MRDVSDAERGDALTMLGLLDQRADLVRRLLEDVRIKALLKIWLYIHVPVSVALCVTLAVHILSVFFFR